MLRNREKLSVAEQSHLSQRIYPILSNEFPWRGNAMLQG
jgi:hypothetical protein